jgi:hypothetical protein
MLGSQRLVTIRYRGGCRLVENASRGPERHPLARSASPACHPRAPLIPRAGTCDCPTVAVRCANANEGGRRELHTDCSELGQICGLDLYFYVRTVRLALVVLVTT